MSKGAERIRRPIEEYGQYVDPNIVGPLMVTRGTVMCDQCGSLIRRNYFRQHQSSGACNRNVQRQKKQDDE